MTVTDRDIAVFRARAKDELRSGCDTGRLRWDDVVEALCQEVTALRASSAAAVESAALRAGLESVRSVLESWYCPDNGTASKLTKLRQMCDALLDTSLTPHHVDAGHYARGLLAIKAITEDHADELDTLGTVYRTAKAFLAMDPAAWPQEDEDEDETVVPYSGLSASGTAALAGAMDKKPTAFKVGDRVSWTDPTTGEKTDGWTVLDAPEIPAEGPGGDEVYRIGNASGFEEEAYARELSYPEGRPL